MSELKWTRTGDEAIDRNLQAIALAFQDGTVAGPNKVRITADYRAAGNEAYIFVDSSRGPVTVNLPSTAPGPIVIKSATLSTNIVYVAVVGNGKINLVAARVEIDPLMSETLVSDGKNWFTV